MRGDNVEPFVAMARTMGVSRYRDEEKQAFYARVAYSCARPWVSAFCMDDGADGTVGISKQALNARLKGWVSALDGLMPGLADWFGVGADKLSCVYNRLIDIDDITVSGFTSRYVAHKPCVVRLTATGALVLGAFDVSDTSADVAGIMRRDMVTSGLCTLARDAGEAPHEIAPFWEVEWDLMGWKPAREIGPVDYICLTANRWSLRHEESWTEEATWVGDKTLARLRASQGQQHLYAARRQRGSVYLSEVSHVRAYGFWLYLRRASGREIVGRASTLDDCHVRISGIPLSVLPPTWGRYVDALTWPVKGIGDQNRRIAHKEATGVLRELLERCCVSLREG